MTTFNEITIPFDNQQEAYAILGDHDVFLREMTENFECKVVSRGDGIVISGVSEEVEQAGLVVSELIGLYRKGTPVTMHEVRYGIRLAKAGEAEALRSLFSDTIIVTARGRNVRAKTLGQRRYVQAIRKNAVTFGIGPAGTGKTYLAVVMAVAFLRARKVHRIILTRPAVEAGERLGFLPGDMQEKVDPYLRPLYDALQDIFGMDTYQKLLAKGTIEIAPLAYMRGRTLDDVFIILDEAQNTTGKQMKMFLTRLGVGSRLVVTGDLSQIDLPRGTRSGLKEAVTVLGGVKGIAITTFDASDIIRHEIVMRIVEAYDAYEKRRHSGTANEERDDK